MGFATANLMPRSISAVYLAQQAIKYNLPVTKTAAAYSQPAAYIAPVAITPIRPAPLPYAPYTPPPTPVVTAIVPPAPLPQVSSNIGAVVGEPPQSSGLNRCGITNPVAAASGSENSNTVTRPQTSDADKRDKVGFALALGGAIMSLLSL
jgi:hypothetical protein